MNGNFNNKNVKGLQPLWEGLKPPTSSGYTTALQQIDLVLIHKIFLLKIKNPDAATAYTSIILFPQLNIVNFRMSRAYTRYIRHYFQ